MLKLKPISKLVDFVFGFGVTHSLDYVDFL